MFVFVFCLFFVFVLFVCLFLFLIFFFKYRPIKGALDKYNTYLFISSSIEDL